MNREPGEISWWADRLTLSPAPATTPTVNGIIHQSASGSCAFLASLREEQPVWVKALGNPQGDQVLVTEFVCSKIARHLGFSVVDSLIVDLPNEFHNQPFGDPQSHSMRSGPAYATQHMGFSLEVESLAHGGASPRTLADLTALWELFLGSDEQWLYLPFHESLNGLFSFDHSLWLDRGAGDWDAAMLEATVDLPWPIETPHDPIPAEESLRVATKLRALSAQTILQVLQAIPLEWEVEITDLATLGWFIYRRKNHLAQRLENQNGE